MGRSIAAVVAAWLLWSAIWLGGAGAARALIPGIPELGQPFMDPPILIGFIVLSVLASVVAGWVCAAVKGGSPMRAVWALALVQLAIGIAVEAAGWANAPAWYHIVFILLLVPATVWGGRLRSGRFTDAGTGARA